MKEYPHLYKVQALAASEGEVGLESKDLPSLQTAPPAEFGGPGDRWSPETLLVAAVADCFILSFRAIARASKLPWNSLSCEVDGILEPVDKVTQFTEFFVHAHLVVPSDVKEATANRILQKAKTSCLITNSLKAKTHLGVLIWRMRFRQFDKQGSTKGNYHHGKLPYWDIGGTPDPCRKLDGHDSSNLAERPGRNPTHVRELR
jgi:organic hydroperoxide reductase OsmC/OhrA|tara:strand:+ start:409 stop:1017 length:609 start_codon:yes stop_codon:yes gene_type:complete